MGNRVVIKAFVMEHFHGMGRKRDLYRRILGPYLIFDQPVKIIPEFMKDIKEENNGDQFPVPAMIGGNIRPALSLKRFDPPVDLKDALVDGFPAGGFGEKACNLEVQLFSQLAERVGKGCIVYGLEKMVFF